MFQFLISRDTAKLTELIMREGARAVGLSPAARMRGLAIADQLGDLSDNSQPVLFPETIGDPGDAGGIRDFLKPVKWSEDYTGVPCVWVLTVENDKAEVLRSFQAVSIHDLFKQTLGVLPVGFIEWAAVSLPGDRIMSYNAAEDRYYNLTVNPG